MSELVKEAGVVGWLSRALIHWFILAVMWILVFICCIIFSRTCGKFLFNAQRVKNLRFFADSTYIACVKFACLTFLKHFGPISLHLGSYHMFTLDELLVMFQFVLFYYQLEVVWDYGCGFIEIAVVLGEDALILGLLLAAFRIRHIHDIMALYLVYILAHLIMSACHTLSFMSISPHGMTVVKKVGVAVRWTDLLLLPIYFWLCRSPVMMVRGLHEDTVYGIIMVATMAGLAIKKTYDVYSGKLYLLAGVVPGVHPMGV